MGVVSFCLWFFSLSFHINLSLLLCSLLIAVTGTMYFSTTWYNGPQPPKNFEDIWEKSESELQKTHDPFTKDPKEIFHKHEPAPYSDPIAKTEMMKTVSAIDARWNMAPIADDGRMKIWHVHNGGSVHSFKYEVDLPVKPEVCVALAKELDLMPSWHKFVPTGKILGERPNIFGGIYAYAEFWMPWPLKNRGILCQSAFYDCLDDDFGAVIVYVGNMQQGKLDEHLGISDPIAIQKELAASAKAFELVPSSETECPRMEFESFTTFTPLSENMTRWNFYFEKTDYQVELPSFFLGFLMKVCAPFVYNIALRLTSNVPQEYVDRMKANDELFYGPLKRRCRQHIRKLAELTSSARASLFSKTILSKHIGTSKNGKVVRRTVGRAPLKIPRSKSMNDLKFGLENQLSEPKASRWFG